MWSLLCNDAYVCAETHPFGNIVSAEIVVFILIANMPHAFQAVSHQLDN